MATREHVLTTAPFVSSSPQVTQASGGVLANELLELNLRSTAAESAHLPMVTTDEALMTR